MWLYVTSVLLLPKFSYISNNRLLQKLADVTYLPQEKLKKLSYLLITHSKASTLKRAVLCKWLLYCNVNNVSYDIV